MFWFFFFLEKLARISSIIDNFGFLFYLFTNLVLVNVSIISMTIICTFFRFIIMPFGLFCRWPPLHYECNLVNVVTTVCIDWPWSLLFVVLYANHCAEYFVLQILKPVESTEIIYTFKNFLTWWELLCFDFFRRTFLDAQGKRSPPTRNYLIV